MIDISVGFHHDGILPVVVGEGIAVQIAVLEALGLAPPDTVHALAAFLGFSAVVLLLPLARADAPGRKTMYKFRGICGVCKINCVKLHRLFDTPAFLFFKMFSTIL